MLTRDKKYNHPFINKYTNNAGGACYVQRCTGPKYVNPGYYITFDSHGAPDSLYKKRFATPAAAARAFFAATARPIASDGYNAIIELDERNERLKTSKSSRWKSIKYNASGRAFFYINGRRYYLDQFLRLDI